jgi:hypothetical protein
VLNRGNKTLNPLRCCIEYVKPTIAMRPTIGQGCGGTSSPHPTPIPRLKGHDVNDTLNATPIDVIYPGSIRQSCFPGFHSLGCLLFAGPVISSVNILSWPLLAEGKTDGVHHHESSALLAHQDEFA